MSQKFDKSITLRPQTSAPSSPSDGMMYYNSQTGKFMQYENGAWKAVSNGDKNYLSAYKASLGTANVGNGNFELGSTTGWSLGTIGTLTNALPTGTPTFGSGASGNLSISAISSGQLAGSYSLSYASSAATTQGDMLASDAFYIDAEDQAKTLSYTVNYKAISGSSNINWAGTSSSSLAVAVYDVTNSVWLPVTNPFGFIQGSGAGTLTGSFQTASTTQQLRFVIYNANATAGAATVYFDDLSIKSNGALDPSRSVGLSVYMASNQSVTANNAIKYDSITTDSHGGYSTGSGAYTVPVSGFYRISINYYSNSGTSNVLLRVNGTSVRFICNGSTINSIFSGTLDYPLKAGDTVTVTPDATCTVVGNSPALNMMSLALILPDSGVSRASTVTMTATKTGGSHSSSGTEQTVASYNTPSHDTYAGFNTSTGEYTVPVTGYYYIGSSVGFVNNGTGFRYSLVMKNGAAIAGSFIAAGSASFNNTVKASIVSLCKAGDVLKIMAYQNSGGSLNYAGGTIDNYFSVAMISAVATPSGPQPTVKATYVATGSITIPHATDTIMNFDSKVIDSHSAVTTGAGWRFTAPISGRYRLTSSIRIASGLSWSVGEQALIRVYKNNFSADMVTADWFSQATHSTAVGLHGSAEIDLVAGDYVDLRVRQDSGGTGSNQAAISVNWITISRVGD